MKKVIIILVIALGVFLVGSPKAEAGYIDGYYTLDAVEILEYDDPVDNDDNVSPSVVDLFESEGDLDFNWLFLFKEFETLDPIDIIFDVENSDGITEYLFVEAILNSTDTSWTDYHVELGFIDEEAYEAGSGEYFISLEDAEALGLGLDFDTPDSDEDTGKDPTPSSFFITGFDSFTTTPIFSTVTHLEDAIGWKDGEIPVFGDFEDEIEELAFLTFSIDVPDNDFGEWGWDEGYSFALRQYPTIDGGGSAIPEPMTMILLGSGFLGAIGLRKKRSL